MGAEVVEQGAGNGSLAHATLVGTDENDSGFGHGTLWITVKTGLDAEEARVALATPASLSPRWHSGRPSIEQRRSHLGNQQRHCS